MKSMPRTVDTTKRPTFLSKPAVQCMLTFGVTDAVLLFSLCQCHCRTAAGDSVGQLTSSKSCSGQPPTVAKKP